MSTQPRKIINRAILFLGESCLEWISKSKSGQPCYFKGIPESMEVGALAQGAQALLLDNGEKPGRCTVLLGEGFIQQKTMTIGKVSENELRSILHRKAANLLATDLRNTVYNAVKLRCEDELRWQISAIHRDKLRALRRALRDVGFVVCEFDFARQTLQAKVQEQLPEVGSEGAAIIVAVEVESVAISLLAKGGLVQQAVVPGKFNTQSPVAASVLQELRSFESYWRRQSRGGSITCVVGSGFTKEEADHLELALHAALPDAAFSIAEGEAQLEKELARVEHLIFCAEGHVRSGDFTLPKPPRKLILVLASCFLLAIGTFAGQQVRHRFQSRSASLGVRIIELESDKQGHLVVEEELESLEVAREQALSRKEHVRSISKMGLDGRKWLSFASTRFDGRAHLESFHLDDSGGPESFSVSGSVPADPLQSVEALTAITVGWEQDEALGNFKLNLPTSVDESKSKGPTLTFQVTTSIGGPVQ